MTDAIRAQRAEAKAVVPVIPSSSWDAIRAQRAEAKTAYARHISGDLSTQSARSAPRQSAQLV